MPIDLIPVVLFLLSLSESSSRVLFLKTKDSNLEEEGIVVKDNIKENHKSKQNIIDSSEDEAIQNIVVKAGEDYQRNCCGPSGYCKACKDQSIPAQTGTVALPLWIQQRYGK